MPKKILLADDSITIQKVVELTFSDGDYEVSAVNNGAKAIQKLSEMRPDIILSDIIMPEKNGYEVCEYVKSHPEYRNIPVVLLTGTFEPFDPDRAEKAGCDAVVTKPFESQSLIHKVEELISQAKSAINATAAVPLPTIPPPAPAPEPEPAPSPWMEETTPTAPPSDASPFTTSGGSVPLPPMDSFTHSPDIFGAAPAPQSTTEMPFDTPTESPFGGAPSAAPFGTQAITPFNMPASDEFSGETRAFPRMSFEEMQQMAAPPAPPAAPEPPPVEAMDASPWDEAPAAEVSPEPSPWGEPEPAAFGGETRAFPKMSFEDLQQQMSAPAPAPELEPEPTSEPSPMSWEEPAAEPISDAWSMSASILEPAEPEPVSSAMPDDLPFAEEAAVSEPEPMWTTTPEDVQAEPDPEAPGAPHAPVMEAPQLAFATESAPASEVASTSSPATLTDDQIDRIARRVVELMSDSVIRNIAWEVIPDLAEMVVKERIRQLESEG